jgi:hypothetical protein
MDAFIQSTLQNCFSIVVAAFLLLRMERELRVLREAIDRLRYCQVCRFAPMKWNEAFDVLEEEKPQNRPGPA